MEVPARAIYPLQSATTSALSENDVAGSPDKTAYSFGLGDARLDPATGSTAYGAPKASHYVPPVGGLAEWRGW